MIDKESEQLETEDKKERWVRVCDKWFVDKRHKVVSSDVEMIQNKVMIFSNALESGTRKMSELTNFSVSHSTINKLRKEGEDIFVKTFMWMMIAYIQIMHKAGIEVKIKHTLIKK